ncbi:LysR family transcriptional regulator [Donghicola tyrosinivorans]|uniref:DNA-binding transcriptional LysR family regulator n=1 Tax=Donghicola tyrosinivorans TaxID=1652492 RepID=A0A2T0WHF6_9RHOB|nr:LysR family transcriptional regulator [Donghicola tyrosinivorans]PRY86126.1 DNA-binding transcriptional LysR family regulator [Donghicola tyrosinivorans]
MADLKSRRLEIDALRVLRAVKQHGGVTRAAEALGLTQSAVSHKIKRLEDSLDCALLTRRPKGPMFTALGLDLLDYAEKILAMHDEALLSLAQKDLSGRIMLGLTEDTTLTDLSRILGRFRRLHPQVAVRTRVRMSLILREQLEAGELDLAIMQMFDHEVRPTDEVLFQEDLHWVASPEFEMPAQGPLPFLSYDPNCFYRKWAMDFGQDAGDVLETVFECSSAAGISAAVKAGLGIALLNGRYVSPDIAMIDSRLPQPPRLSYVVRRARKTHNPALEGLINEIRAEIGRKGGLSLAG